MKRSNGLTWLSVLCLSIVCALLLNRGLVAPSLTGSDRADRQFASPSDRVHYTEKNPYQLPFSEEQSEEVIDNEISSVASVNFPARYQQQFLQYVTVDCPNSRIVRKIYVNPAAVDSLRKGEQVPSETVLLMETYSAQRDSDGLLQPTQLNNVFIREKRAEWQVNENSGEWKSAWFSPEGRLLSSTQSSCISCHVMVRDRDYVFTLPALLEAAKTGQTQHQETEFGTSVCR